MNFSLKTGMRYFCPEPSQFTWVIALRIAATAPKKKKKKKAKSSRMSSNQFDD